MKTAEETRAEILRRFNNTESGSSSLTRREQVLIFISGDVSSDQNSTLQKEVEETHDVIDHLKETCDNYEKEVERLKGEKTVYDEAFDEINEINGRLIQKNSSLTKELSDLSDDYQKLIDNSTEEKTIYYEEIQGLRKELEEAKASLSTKSSFLENCSESHGILEAKISLQSSMLDRMAEALSLKFIDSITKKKLLTEYKDSKNGK